MQKASKGQRCHNTKGTCVQAVRNQGCYVSWFWSRLGKGPESLLVHSFPCMLLRLKVPPMSPRANALRMTPSPAHSYPWPPHAGNHFQGCLTALRGAMACPGECLLREQALNWFSRLTVIPSWEAAHTGTEQSSWVFSSFRKHFSARCQERLEHFVWGLFLATKE